MWNFISATLPTKVSIHWIPAHVGITGNEIADTESKQSTNHKPEILRILLTDLKPYCKNLSKGKVYCQRLYKHSMKALYTGLDPSAEVIILVSTDLFKESMLLILQLMTVATILRILTTFYCNTQYIKHQEKL